MRLAGSEATNVGDRPRKCLRRFLRQVVADATLDGAVFVLARELSRVRRRIRLWGPVGIALEGNRRNRDGGRCGKALEIVVTRFAVSQPETPAVIVNDD